MDPLVAKIKTNLQAVTAQMSQAAQSAGRDVGQVKLVIVTKAQPVGVISAVVEAGGRFLGENYPEETVPKIQSLGTQEGIYWHMIGHLQSRKAGLVAEYFDALHSLDTVRLAQKLDQQLSEKNRTLPVLLELNVGGEESKNGWPAWDETSLDSLLPDVEEVLSLEHLPVQGLMAMPPWNEDPEASRPYFVRLRRLSEVLARRFGEEHFRELSMGTSVDFVPGIQEGATYVRIGQAIVGPRPVRK
jgi:pyridoxal phosphate enzyme (YggS family)